MRWTRFLLYPAMLVMDLVAWFLGCWIRLFFGKSWRWEDGQLIIVLPRTGWPGQRLKAWGAWTFGHQIVVFDDCDNPTLLLHERTHVKQLEMAALAGHFMGFAVAWPHWQQAVFITVATPITVYLCGYIVAKCYGGNAYRDNPNEVAAYDHAAESVK